MKERKINTPWTSFCRVLLLAAAAALLFGCGRQKETPATLSGTSRDALSSSLPEDLFLTQAPDGAVPVAMLKETAAEGDRAVVRVVVGGRKKPIVAGRAAWTAVDAGFNNACTRGGHACPEPWDYCCAAPDQLAPNMLTIQVQDADGRPLAVDLTESGSIAPMTTMVVKGIVGPRSNPETLVLNAAGIYVEPEPQG